FDAVLIKNNHITAAGGIRRALERTRNYNGTVEIEVRTRAELDEALAAGAKRLLLDNLSPAEAAQWIQHIAGRATVELSGGINLENIRAYAEAGPEFISSGAITHSAIAVDISFRLGLDERRCLWISRQSRTAARKTSFTISNQSTPRCGRLRAWPPQEHRTERWRFRIASPQVLD